MDVVAVIFRVVEVQPAAAVAAADALVLVEESGADFVDGVELVCPIGRKFLRAGGLMFKGDL